MHFNEFLASTQQKNPQNWSSANIDETYVHFKDNEKIIVFKKIFRVFYNKDFQIRCIVCALFYGGV